MPARPWIIAHRGASAVAPENTMAAFERAFRDRADGIELDVRLSADGVPVVFHDQHLSRIAGAAGNVHALTLSELRQYSVGAWFSPAFASERIPTLAQALDLARGRGIVNVEIKSVLWRRIRGESPMPPIRDLARAVLRTLQVHADPEWIVVSSFDPRVLRAIRARDPRWRTGFLRWHQQRAIGHWPLWKYSRADYYHPDVPLAAEAARWTGGWDRLLVWTVDSGDEQHRLSAQGVRAIITNRPAQARARIDALHSPIRAGLPAGRDPREDRS